MALRERVLGELGGLVGGRFRPRRFPRAAPFDVRVFPAERAVVLDALAIGASKHMMHGLIEVDVTESRRRMREAPGRLSFTCFVIACVARAAAEHPLVHAYRAPGGRLYCFDRVDVNTLVEVTSGERRFPVAHVMRAADQRSVDDLTEELRAVQCAEHAGPASERPSWIARMVALPVAVRRPVYQWVLAHPPWLQQLAGTLTVSAVGMFAQGAAGGFAIGPPSVHNLQVVVGGIARRGDREVAQMTFSFNHDLVDGGPAARFATRVRELLEDGAWMSAGPPRSGAA